MKEIQGPSQGTPLLSPYVEPTEPLDFRQIYGQAMLDLSRHMTDGHSVDADRAMRWVNRVFEAAVAAVAEARRRGGDESAAG